MPTTTILLSPSDGAMIPPDSVILSWEDQSEYFDYYYIVVSSSSDAQGDIANVFPVYGGSFDCTTYLPSDGTYYWNIIPHLIDADWGDGGDLWSFTTSTPYGPPSLSSPGDGDTGVGLNPTLYWSDTGAPLYNISICYSPGGTNFENTYTGNTYLTTNTLEYSTTYYWQVLSETQYNGWSDWSSLWSFTTEDPPPPRPDIPTLSSPSNGATGLDWDSLAVSWNSVDYATSYGFELSYFSDFHTWIEYNNFGDVTSIDLGGGVDGIQKGDTLYWRIEAENDSGESGWSDTWSFTILASGPANVKTIYGIPIANIKTINGIPIANIKSINGLQ